MSKTITHTIAVEVEDPLGPDRLSPDLLISAAQRAVEGVTSILSTAPVVNITINTFVSESSPATVEVGLVDSVDVEVPK